MGDEYEALWNFDRRMERMRVLAKPFGVPSIALQAAETVGAGVIQSRHAIIPESEYRRGESPAYREQFVPLYSSQPRVETPTPVRVVYIEDGIGPKARGNNTHGMAAAASGSAAWQAMTGEAHMPSILVNRSAYEDALTWQRATKLSPSMPPKWQTDLALPYLRSHYLEHPYTVYSTSTTFHNDQIRGPAERQAGIESLSRFYGQNAIFIQSSGNYADMRAGQRHTSFTSHPSTLTIGATQGWTSPEGARVLHLESYSSYGPDMVCETNPDAARYLGKGMFGLVDHQVTNGTSFSAPQAAAIVGTMLRRFALSPENPAAVLSREDVIYALRNTTQPVHVRECDSFRADTCRHALLTQRRMDGRLVSEEAGNGQMNPAAAWALMERMEKEVHGGKARIKPRHEVRAAFTIDKNLIPETDGFFHYPVKIPDDLHADTIVIDIRSPDLSRTDSNDKLHTPVFLGSPSGGMLRLFPSADSPSGYLIARAPGFHGEKMTGNWVLMTMEPIQDAQINFHNAIEPGHVTLEVKPDAAQRERQLYRTADFRRIPPAQIDAALLANAPPGSGPALASHDFSQTGFPDGYLPLRLVQLVEQGDLKSAEALAGSGHPSLTPHKDALIAAIKAGDPKAVLDIWAPDDKAKYALLVYAVTKEPPAMANLLLDRGYARLQPPPGAPSLVASVASEEQDRILENWTYKPEMLPLVVAAIEKEGGDVLAPGPDGRRVRGFIWRPQLVEILQQAETRQRDRQFAALMEEQVKGWQVETKPAQKTGSVADAADMLKSLGVIIANPLVIGPSSVPFGLTPPAFKQPGGRGTP